MVTENTLTIILFLGGAMHLNDSSAYISIPADLANLMCNLASTKPYKTISYTRIYK
jgi:hypothetical protein